MNNSEYKENAASAVAKTYYIVVMYWTWLELAEDSDDHYRFTPISLSMNVPIWLDGEL